MLTIKLETTRFFNEATDEIITVPGREIQMEHSLISLSKWESKWKVPFLSDNPRTTEQTLDYLACMTITKGIDPMVFQSLPSATTEEISKYINDAQTATTISNNGNKSRQIITAEVIYGWMVALQIPFECEKWHLNRLLTLVQVCNENNKGDKKMSRSERASAIERRKAMNQARRQAMGTTG